VFFGILVTRPVDKNTSTRLNSAHLYATAGTYTVTLTRNEISGPVVYTKVITINQPPRPFYLGNDPSQQDTTICKGDKLKLDPYRTGGAEPQFKYIWFPKGDTTQTVLADSTTCYSVQVTDTLTGCSTENKLNVKLCVPPPPQPPKEYWYFGQGAGILFQNGEPTADGNGKTNSLEGVAGITDTKGNTIFYSDGKNVYRTDGTLMPSVSSSIP
jgi:PKD repeat protein